MLAALLAVQAQRVDEAERQFKAAQNLELVDGNLKAAIEQYGKVARGGNRALAAQALYKMGECQEKLGQAEARKSFERVVKEYGDQGEVVSRARIKLGGGTAPEQGMRIREFAPAAKGCMPQLVGARFADCFRPEGILIRDLQTGQERLILSSKERQGRFFPGAFSPDGKTLTYFEMGSGLRAIEIDGTGDRLLAKPQFGSGAFPLLYGLWTKDGQRLLLAFPVDGGSISQRELAFVSLADGKKTALQTLDVGPIPDAVLSPDDQYIALKEGGVLGESLRIIPAAGGPSWVLEGTGPVRRLVGWHASGHVFYTSPRMGGEMGIWAIRVDHGKSTGEPRLLHGGIHPRIRPWIGRDGALHVDDWGGQNLVQTAAIDVAAGRLSSPKPATKLFSNGNWTPEYSADGKRMLYATAYAPGTVKFVIQDLTTGKETVYPAPFRTVGTTTWHPDGSSLVVNAVMAEGGKWNLYRFVPSTSEVKTLAEDVLWPWTRAGKTMFYGLHKDGKNAPIRMMDLVTGATTEIRFSIGADRTAEISISPDGRNIGYLYSTNPEQDFNRISGVARVAVAPLAGGSERILIERPRGKARGQVRMAWTPDGKHLVYSIPAETGGSEVWLAGAEGGAPVKLHTAKEEIMAISIHPNGRDVAFATNEEGGRFLVIENPLAARRQ
jgi:Tol biopolymer transport system component